MRLESRNLDGYRLMKFVRVKDKLFVNEPACLDHSHLKIMEMSDIQLPGKPLERYKDILENINYDFGTMRVRKGKIEILFENDDISKSKKETARVLSKLDKRVDIEVVFVNGLYSKEELAIIMSEVKAKKKKSDNNKTGGKQGRWVDEDYSLLRDAIYIYNGGYCQDCGTNELELDLHHIFPIEYGGSRQDAENITPLCLSRERKRFKENPYGLSCHDKWQAKVKMESVLFPGIFIKEIEIINEEKREEERKKQAVALRVNSNKQITSHLHRNDISLEAREGGRAY